MASTALIVWADPASTNLGVQALAAGAARVLRMAWPDVSIDFQGFGPNEEGLAFGTRAVLADLAGAPAGLRSRIGRFDAVLDMGGGDSFTDIYGVKRLIHNVHIARRARSLGVPVIMGPQTIGPFRTRAGRRLAAAKVASCTEVLVRDPVSLRSYGELGGDRARLATDLVFGLPVPDAVPDRFDVLVNVSGLLWNENPHVDAGKYRSDIRSLCERLTAAGRDVTLLAHVLDSPSPDNDVPAVHRLQADLGGSVTTFVPRGLDDVRGAIAASRLVIGARMHACLNALSVGTPAVAWSYSRKFEPLLDDLGWKATVDLRHGEDVVEQTMNHVVELEYAAGDALEGVRSVADERLAVAVEAIQGVARG